MPNQPPIDIPDPELPGEPSSDSWATKEVASYPRRWYGISRHEKGINLSLKILLFLFVLFMNVWWTHRVLQLLWHSADRLSQYHLSDTVLVALVTTSIANFIALVAIVARHLFPTSKTPPESK